MRKSVSSRRACPSSERISSSACRTSVVRACRARRVRPRHRAGLGMEIDVEAVLRRERAMSPIEVMTSESQERMLAIVTPEALERVRRFVPALGDRGERDRNGRGGGRWRRAPACLWRSGSANCSLTSRRPRSPTRRRNTTDRCDPPADLAQRQRNDARFLEEPEDNCNADLLALLNDASWIYRQYDHQLFLNTVLGPGEGDATVLKLAAPGIGLSVRRLALSSDANPNWCAGRSATRHRCGRLPSLPSTSPAPAPPRSGSSTASISAILSTRS